MQVETKKAADPADAERKARKAQRAREAAVRKAQEARDAASRKAHGGASPIGVDEYAVAAAMDFSVHTVRKDRYTHRRIPFYRIRTSIRYNLDRVREALAALEEGGK